MRGISLRNIRDINTNWLVRSDGSVLKIGDGNLFEVSSCMHRHLLYWMYLTLRTDIVNMDIGNHNVLESKCKFYGSNFSLS